MPKDNLNALEMSDEDFFNMPFPVEEESSSSESTESSELNVTEDQGDEDTSSDDTNTATDTESEETEEYTDTNTASEDTEDNSEEDLNEGDPSNSDSDDETDEDSDDSVEDVSDKDIEFKAGQYEELLKPFRANGKEISISSVDEARQLMQMGANYSKKMAGLKPSLKILKMLENNSLLDESKLSYLIDLDKKNPEAITKLIKESGVNPLDIDVEKEAEYTPNTYTVNENEIELDQVLSDIKDTPSYKDTVDVISNKWDESSKRVLVSNPATIKVINDHIQSGIYDEITNVVEKKRMLGQLNGLSDIDAYKQVGTELHEARAFKVQQQANTSSKPSSTNNTVPAATRKQDESKLKSRKKAASTTSTKANTSKTVDFNPLSLSDEEFEKVLASGKF